ncbi:MAG: Hsp20/alpha crystallin family protein [Oligoflexia bacterium]|nr:Hsp20/alpha crystallin family protein [Oligoflexia bacterium]
MAMRNLPEIQRESWSPLRELNRMQRRIDRMFDEFFSGTPFPNLIGPTRSLLEMGEREYIPACDVQDSDTQYLLSFDLPGVKKEDVKIDLRDNLLTVSGERKEESYKEEKGKRVSEERMYGSFVRSFTLPSGVDPNKVEASYENGVLQIAIPKAPEAQGRHIPIKEGKLLGQRKAA